MSGRDIEITGKDVDVLIEEHGVRKFGKVFRGAMGLDKYAAIFQGKLKLSNGGFVNKKKALANILGTVNGALQIDLIPELIVELHGTKVVIKIPDDVPRHASSKAASECNSVELVLKTEKEATDWLTEIMEESKRLYVTSQMLAHGQYNQALHCEVWKKIRGGNDELRRFYFCNPIIPGGNVLLNRLHQHVRALLDNKEQLEQSDGIITAELLSHAMRSSTFRGYCTCVFPDAQSFLHQIRNEHERLSGVSDDELALQYINMLFRRFEDRAWAENRIFLKVLKFPTDSAAAVVTAEELEWVQSCPSLQIKYLDLNLSLLDSPYLSCVIVRQYLANQELALALDALTMLPTGMLIADFEGISTVCPAGAVNTAQSARHFVELLLDIMPERTVLRRFVDVFVSKDAISDAFLRSLLSASVKGRFSDTNSGMFMACLVTELIFFRGDNRFDLNFKNISFMPNAPEIIIDALIDAQHARRAAPFDPANIWMLVDIVVRLEAVDKESPFVSELNTLSKMFSALSSRRDSAKFTETRVKVEKIFASFSLTRLFFIHLTNEMGLLYNVTEAGPAQAGNTAAGQPNLPPPPPRSELPDFFDKPTTRPMETESVVVNQQPAAPQSPQVATKRRAAEDTMFGFFAISLTGELGIFEEFLARFPHQNVWLTTFLSKTSSLRKRLALRCNGMNHYVRALIAEGKIWLHSSDFSIQGLKCISSPLGGRPKLNSLLIMTTLYISGKDVDPKFWLDDAVKWCLADGDKNDKLLIVLNAVEKKLEEDLESISSNNSSFNQSFRNLKLFRDRPSMTLEDITACADHICVAMGLLAEVMNDNGLVVLKTMVDNYLRMQPKQWRDKLRGMDQIAYFIRYMDRENLELAYAAYHEKNQGQQFTTILESVRALLPRTIVEPSVVKEMMTAYNENAAHDPMAEVVQQLESEAAEVAAGDKMGILKTICANWMRDRREAIGIPMVPRNVQMITMLAIADWYENAPPPAAAGRPAPTRSIIGQMGTGEGKSLIIAMMAVYFVKSKGKRVHVLENNIGLLDKDFNQFTRFYESFDIPAYKDSGFGETHEFGPIGTPSVTYCLRGAVEKYYRETTMNKLNPFEDTILIVDEVDDLVVDSNPIRSYANPDNERRTIMQLFDLLVRMDGNVPVAPDDSVSDFAWTYAKTGYDIGKNFLLNVNYGLLDGQYWPLHPRTRLPTKGEASPAIDFVNYKELQIPPTAYSAFFIQCLPHIFGRYEAIVGLSGSLGSPSERSYLETVYNASFFEVPPFLNTCDGAQKHPPTLIGDHIEIYETEDAQRDAVVALAIEKMQSVPVVVISKNPAEAQALRVKVIQAVTRIADQLPAGTTPADFVQLLTERDVETTHLLLNYSAVVEHATKRVNESTWFRITVTDPFGGRGHDYMTNDDSVNEAGGIAVIIATLPGSERDWTQWKGRTARSDRRGQYAVILYKDTLPTEKLTASREAPGSCYYRASLLDNLFSIIDSAVDQNLRQLEVVVKRGSFANDVCDKFYGYFGNIDKNNWPRNKAEKLLRNYLNKTSDHAAEGTRVFFSDLSALVSSGEALSV